MSQQQFGQLIIILPWKLYHFEACCNILRTPLSHSRQQHLTRPIREIRGIHQVKSTPGWHVAMIGPSGRLFCRIATNWRNWNPHGIWGVFRDYIYVTSENPAHIIVPHHFLIGGRFWKFGQILVIVPIDFGVFRALKNAQLDRWIMHKKRARQDWQEFHLHLGRTRLPWCDKTRDV